ncbi:MAG: hypothetical protein ACI9BD_001443 [Candidatus Marinamargulisbacteria bacterium]|jgi:hypothetical protein
MMRKIVSGISEKLGVVSKQLNHCKMVGTRDSVRQRLWVSVTQSGEITLIKTKIWDVPPKETLLCVVTHRKLFPDKNDPKHGFSAFQLPKQSNLGKICLEKIEKDLNLVLKQGTFSSPFLK